jgi:hypothetical protein
MNEASSGDFEAPFHCRIELLSRERAGKGARVMIIFLVLNAIGVIFMLYVLTNFLKEGRRITHSVMRPYRLGLQYGITRQVFVATRPVGLEAKQPGKTSLIQFPVAKACTNVVGRESAQAGDIPTLRKYSSG